MEQQYKLPGVGQLGVCCAPSLLVHGGGAGEEEEQEWGREMEKEVKSEGHSGVQVCS